VNYVIHEDDVPRISWMIYVMYILCIYLRAYIFVYIHVYTYIYIYIYMYMYIYIYIYICVCVYIYMYTCVCKYVHKHRQVAERFEQGLHSTVKVCVRVRICTNVMCVHVLLYVCKIRCVCFI